ncbi:MAG TPA: hypothetical protein VGM25_08685 [Caulobacteraceae bacterium]|jgi:hypothetical protein
MRSLVSLAAALILIAAPAFAAPALVTVKDKGVKTDCAEEDNVYAVLSAPGVRSFEVEARHPAYAAELKQDTDKPNFKNCTFQPQKDFPLTPRKVTLYRDDKVMIRGITYSGYWRPSVVKVDVAGKKDQGFTLIQFFQREGKTWHEALVLHAPDGYWRLRPLPLPQFKGAVYGSSFLIGPVEESTRPYVRITEVKIDPKARRFTVSFDKGGQAVFTITSLDHQALEAKVTLDPPVETGRPFVALRSMYVAPDNADAAELRWTAPGGEKKVEPVVGFGHVQASAVGFEKSKPSLHNTSAPDIRFSDFQN